jgi:hypothetical protein
MRTNLTTASLVVATLLFATAGFAFERTTVRADRDGMAGWDASASCSVFYANICTDWIHVWGDWPPLTRLGVILEPCCPDGHLVSTQVYFWTGSYAGYWYTGTVALFSVVGNCPGTLLDSYAYLPIYPAGGGDQHNWNNVPAGPVALTYWLPVSAPAGYPTNPVTVPTDHPDAGPTGPQACGLCYPSTRETHSYYWGTSDSPLCPGSPFSDDVCNAELLYWGGSFTCTTSIEPKGWGAIKNLYR